MNKKLKYFLISIGIIIAITIFFSIDYLYKFKKNGITGRIMTDAECQKTAQYYLDQDKEMTNDWDNTFLSDSRIFHNLKDEPVLKVFALKKNDTNLGYISINMSYDRDPFFEISAKEPPFNLSVDKKYLLKLEFERDVEISKFIYLGGLNYYASFENNKGDINYIVLSGQGDKQILTLEEIEKLDFTNQIKVTAESAIAAHQIWKDILGE